MSCVTVSSLHLRTLFFTFVTTSGCTDPRTAHSTHKKVIWDTHASGSRWLRFTCATIELIGLQGRKNEQLRSQATNEKTHLLWFTQAFTEDPSDSLPLQSAKDLTVNEEILDREGWESGADRLCAFSGGRRAQELPSPRK